MEKVNLESINKSIEMITKKISDIISNNKVVDKKEDFQKLGLDALSANTNFELLILTNQLAVLTRIRMDLIASNNQAK